MPSPSKQVSYLRKSRLESGLTQREVAEGTGIPLITYRRLERGEIFNPGVRLLVNCCKFLRVPIWEVLQDDWLQWTEFNEAQEPAGAPDFIGDI